MEELLTKLLENEVLSPETKEKLEETFKGKIEEAVEAAKKEAEADVRTELTEQWVKERDALIEAIDTKVGEFLQEELTELREDIDRFRDLEAEYAEKLVEAKASMSNELKGDLAELVEKIDAFLEIRLAAEMEELREDINAARRNDFGRRIFEAVADEYAKHYADEESVEGNLRETEERLADTQEALEEVSRKLAQMERKERLNEVLRPLDGRPREIMEAILRNVATDQLEEGYRTFIGRVMSKAAGEEVSEKEEPVLAENASVEGENKTLNRNNGVVVTGDNEEVLKEEAKAAAEQHRLTEGTRRRLQTLAGL